MTDVFISSRKDQEYVSPPLSAARTVMRSVVFAAVLIALVSLSASAPLTPWEVYAFQEGAFRSLVLPGQQAANLLVSRPSDPPATPSPELVPSAWRLTASALADVTGDGLPEWALVVWRPWRDWPIQSWSTAPSPIAGFHDAAGASCHLILLDPRDGREVWAGSALPAPILALAVGDVDGDGRSEVVTLEGDYATGRDGPASRVDVWKWNGFGFTLEWRSPPGVLHRLGLTDATDDGILDMVVR
jgi:hypothetical protein